MHHFPFLTWTFQQNKNQTFSFNQLDWPTNLTEPQESENESSNIALVPWGGSKGPALDAFNELREEGVDLSFLDGAIFRIALGDFNEYHLPVDIYLHEDLVMVPLGEDYFSYTCGNYESFIKAEAYLKNLTVIRYPEAHIIAFKDGVRTDFSNSEE